MERNHTDRQYDRELDELRERVLLMAARVEEMTADAMRAFSERDEILARRIIAADSKVDRMEVEVDNMCISLLARRQPAASDLHFVTSSLKLVTDLERIGDLAVNICERSIELMNFDALPEARAVERIGNAAQSMLHDAIDAFVAGDTFKAEQVIERDSVVDAYYAQLFPELVTAMVRQPSVIGRATGLQSVGKYLERIADHATNIAEMVVFIVKGKDVRHKAARPN